MEITKRLLNDLAGWKAMKEARRMHEAGLVLQAEAKQEGVYRGLVQVGNKQLGAGLQIISKTEAIPVCSCPAFRREGFICPHSLAVVLEVMEPKKPVLAAEISPEKEVSQAEGVNEQWFRVSLPPTFPMTFLERGGVVEVEVVDSIPEEWGRSVLFPRASWPEWLSQSGYLQVGVEQVSAFLSALIDSPFVQRKGRGGELLPCRLTDRPLCLALDVVRKGEFLMLSLLDPPALAVIRAKEGLWLWNHEESLLMRAPVGKGVSPDLMVSLFEGEPCQISVRDFLRHSSSWSEGFELGPVEVMDALVGSEISPVMKAQVAGSSRDLKLNLSAQYGELELEIAAQATEEILEVMEGQYCRRQPVLEQEAAQVLLREGWQWAGGAQFQIEGADEVLHALAYTIPQLESLGWKIEEEKKLTARRGQLVTLDPQLEISGSGEDWLEFDLQFQMGGGKSIPKADIDKILRSGKSSVPTQSGKTAVIPKEQISYLKETIYDLDAQQQNGKFHLRGPGCFHLIEMSKNTTELANNKFLKQEYKLSQFHAFKTFDSILRLYQKEGLLWMRTKCEQLGGILLADDMGLGKTLQALLLSSWLQQDHPGRPVLVVCPSSLVGNWSREIARWLPEVQAVEMRGKGRHERWGELSCECLIITSYALLHRDLERYQELSPLAVILDEASLIRNPDSQMAKACHALNADYRVALTGTPVENSVRDLWSLFEFLSPGYLGAKKEFQDRFEKEIQAQNQVKMRLLRDRTRPFLLRRTKEQVTPELPRKLEVVEYCDLTDEQSALYRGIMTQGQEKIAQAGEKQGNGAAHMAMLTTLLRLRQSCCDLRLLPQVSPETKSAKLTRLMELIEQGVPAGRRFLVFSQFASMLRLIAEALTEAGYDYCHLDGSTSDRDAQVTRFQVPDGPPVFLISLKAGGYGLTLTEADTVIHFDPWWNPAVEAQATDRAYRIGQTRPVTVYKMIATGTVEEKVLRLQQRKKGVLDQAISDDQSLMQGLSSEEVQGILN